MQLSIIDNLVGKREFGNLSWATGEAWRALRESGGIRTNDVLVMHFIALLNCTKLTRNSNTSCLDSNYHLLQFINQQA